MAAALIQRLAALGRENVHFVGSSATIARPDEHAGQVFGVESSKVCVVTPSTELLDVAGLNHHVFLRPARAMSTMGALVNTTSMVVHGRRDGLSNSRRIGGAHGNDRKRPKAIGFADNLDVIGRWRDDLQENERRDQFNRVRRLLFHQVETSLVGHVASVNCLMPFDTTLRCNVACWPKESRQRRRGPVLANLSHLLSNQQDLCKRCKQERKLRLVMRPRRICTNCENKSIASLIWKRTWWIRSSLTPHFNQDGGAQIGTLDSCPFLKAGACDWFSASDTMESEAMKRDAQSEFFTWKEGLRTRIVSGKTEQNQEDGRIEERLYRGSTRLIHQGGYDGDSHALDMVISSPSLEVGVDIPMLTESIMIRSVRNMLTYRRRQVGSAVRLDTMC